MDPDANLSEQLDLAANILTELDAEGGTRPPNYESIANQAQLLAELVFALDEWITGGGFLPEAWRSTEP